MEKDHQDYCESRRGHECNCGLNEVVPFVTSGRRRSKSIRKHLQKSFCKGPICI